MWIALFCNGCHAVRRGKRCWDRSDVEQIFEATKKKLQAGEKVPLTIRHPGNDLPVLGWITDVRLREEESDLWIDGFLAEKAEGLEQVFEQTPLRRVSVALRKDRSIRHVGLVEHPAVQKLPPITEPVAFEASDEEVEVFQQRTTPLERLFLRLREYIIEQSGIEKANEVMPPFDIEMAIEELQQQAPEAPPQLSADKGGRADEILTLIRQIEPSQHTVVFALSDAGFDAQQIQTVLKILDAAVPQLPAELKQELFASRRDVGQGYSHREIAQRAQQLIEDKKISSFTEAVEQAIKELTND